MDINPSDLRCFIEVSRTLNISRASEKLGMGQPALSQIVQRLEAQLGTTLLDRYKTGVRLTSAGIRLVKMGQVALENWSKLKEEALAAETAIEGNYSLGCHPSVALFTLRHIIPGLLRTYPHLHFRLIHGLSREIAEGVISFRIDFGIVVNPVRHPDLIIKQLCVDEVGFWRTAHAPDNTLICDPSLAQSQALIKKVAKTLRIDRSLESSNLEVIADLASSGCGVAILPNRVAARHSSLKLLGHLPKCTDRVCLVYRADRKLSAAAAKVIQAIRHAEI